jgi:hypothetical protein
MPRPASQVDTFLKASLGQAFGIKQSATHAEKTTSIICQSADTQKTSLSMMI